LDNTPAQYPSRSPVRDTQIINFLSQVFPNPFNGTNPIYGSTTSRGNLLRPFPQFIIAALQWRSRWASPGIALQGAHRFNTNAGFNRNSAQQSASNIRVSSVRFGGIRADGQARWDFSAIKNFQISEN